MVPSCVVPVVGRLPDRSVSQFSGQFPIFRSAVRLGMGIGRTAVEDCNMTQLTDNRAAVPAHLARMHSGPRLECGSALRCSPSGFRMIDRKTGEEHIIARQRLRTVSILRPGGGRQWRPVVARQICPGGRVPDTAASLVGRSERACPQFPGRAALGSCTLMEAGNIGLSGPGCAANVEDQEHRL